MVNVNRYGNTSAASVPIALCEAREQGRIGREKWPRWLRLALALPGAQQLSGFDAKPSAGWQKLPVYAMQSGLR
jgi:hypothetical protein